MKDQSLENILKDQQFRTKCNCKKLITKLLILNKPQQSPMAYNDKKIHKNLKQPTATHNDSSFLKGNKHRRIAENVGDPQKHATVCNDARNNCLGPKSDHDNLKRQK